MTRCRLIRLVLGVLAVVATGGPAQAKMPEFEVHMPATSGVPGTSLMVTVTVETFRSEGARGPRDLDGLLGLLPADEVTDAGTPAIGARASLIDLRRTTPGRYTGTLTLPSAPGDYLLIPFPQEYRISAAAVDRPIVPITVTAAPAKPPAAAVSAPDRLWGWLAVAAAGIAAIVVAARRRRSRADSLCLERQSAREASAPGFGGVKRPR